MLVHRPPLAESGRAPDNGSGQGVCAAVNMGGESRYCCLSESVGPEAIRREPFPHLVIRNALPPALYLELESRWPGLQRIAGPGALENNRAYKLAAPQVLADPDIAAPWREFFAFHTSREFLRRVLDLWAGELAVVHPALSGPLGTPLQSMSAGLRRPGKRRNRANRRTDIVLDCQFVVNSPVNRAGSVRGPHLDNPAKLFAALLYFRDPADAAGGGDLQLYRPRPGRRPATAGARVDRGSIELAAEIPYAPNTLVMWLNSPVAVHGVSPRAVTPIPRRYINLLGECYGQGISFTDPVGLRPGFWHRARLRKTAGSRPTPQATLR